MKKCNKKGFSLVEILAVIIILAILALITIPFVANLIKQARINAAVVSAYGYVEAANNEIVSKHTKGEDVEETQYDIKDYNIVGDLLNVKYEGRGPEKGYFNVERVKVSNGLFCINGYEIVYEEGRAVYDSDGTTCSKIEPPALCTYKTAIDTMLSNNKDTNKYSEMTEFYIENADDMYCFAELVNSGKESFQNKTVIIKNDIDMTETNKYSGQSFNPIGNTTNNFKGTFRSSNFNTISNLTISKSGVDNVGLFGYLPSGATVGEFNLDHSNITGGQYVGSIAGQNYGTVKAMNLSIVGVSGSSGNIGGVAGANFGTIEVITFRGSVSGSRNIGGIVGGNGPFDNTAVIKSALVNANVSGWDTYSNAGGIAGGSNAGSGYTPGIIQAVVEGGTISGNRNTGKGTGDGYSTTNSLIYVSTAVTAPATNGNAYNKDYHSIGMFDDVLDTIYGGDSDGDGYFFDFNKNGEYVVVKVNDNSFDTTIQGSGTESDPYILASSKDFKDAALLLNGGYYFKISDNLDLTSETFGHFYPLGTQKNYFSGHIDGNNKTISNMNLNTGRYGGFIGYINNGSINNIGFTSSIVANRYNDDGRTGLLIGTTGGTVTITDILDSSSITVSGRNYVGGLVGILNATSTLKGLNLTTGTVSGNYAVGGLIGQNSGKASAVNIKGVSVSGSSWAIGGLVGNNPGTIEEMTFRGSVSGSRIIGGAVGALGEWNSNDSIGGKIIGVLVNANVSGWEQYTYVGGIAGGSTNSTGISGTINAVYEGGKVSGNRNVGKTNGSRNLGLVYVSNAVEVSRNASSGDGNIYNKDYHSIGMYDDVLDTYYGGDSDGSGYYFDYNDLDELVVVKVNEHSFDTTIQGSGTESDPYILGTEKDFKDAAILGNTLAYYKIANDLDISTFNHFYPLGTYKNYFSGHIDGNNKIISNMNINTGRYGGLIGYLNGGSLKDLTINTSIVANRYGVESRTGFFIGNAGTTQVSNIGIGSNQTISGQSYLGGLIGVLGSNSTLTNLHDISYLTVSGNSNYVGGIVGVVGSGVNVEGFNVDHITVTGSGYTGGLFGQNSGTAMGINVSNGSVSGNSMAVGGLVGNNPGTIKEMTFRGSVSSSRLVGGAVGTLGEWNSNDSIGGKIIGVLVNANVSGWEQYTYVGGIVGGSTNSTGISGTINAVYEGGKVSGNRNVGKTNGSRNLGLVYVSNAVEVSRNASSGDGNIYNKDYHSVAMYDDVLDTIYGGDSDGSGYYFDYDENDQYVVVKATAHSFDTTIQGSGTESDPYILATEKDFKDAAIIGKTLAYYRIADDLDISSFTHFYPLGTNKNYFTGHVDGNNKVITNMNINTGKYGGFIGYLNGGSLKDLTINSSAVANRFGVESRTGLFIGHTSSGVSISNITLGSNQTVSGQSYMGGLIGVLGSNSTITNLHDISYLTVSGNSNYVGGVIGVLGSGITIGGFNVDHLTVSSYGYTGGLFGQNNGTAIGINVSNASVSGSNQIVGGIAGNNLGTIQEVTFRGSVSGSRNIGGIAGTNGTFDNTAVIRSALVNANVSGWETYTNAGGIAGGSNNGSGYTPGYIYAVIEGGTISGNRNTGKATGDGYQSNRSSVYVSSAVSSSGTNNGIAFNSSNNGNLAYYKTLKYTYNNVQYPILDSPEAGDINNSGYWFVNNADGDIVVARTTSDIIPEPEVCEEEPCDEPTTPPIDLISTNTGSCEGEDADVTPPTCVFDKFEGVSNGIRAYFSCTDDTSVPTIASMFNSTTKQAYTYDMIIDSQRDGTVKKGSVNGNTRTVRTTWTTDYNGPKPQQGLCYYYQFAARDECGNEANYVTSNCAYGFNNGTIVTP